MKSISERGLGLVLTELRKIDRCDVQQHNWNWVKIEHCRRDRERALPPETVSRILEAPKYRLGLSPALSKLLAKYCAQQLICTEPRFPNPQIAGYVNYEKLLEWLEQRRVEAR